MLTRTKVLLRNWSSVSAAAAALVGLSRPSVVKADLPEIGLSKAADGNDPLEPLILKPSAVKLIPEWRFAGHRSHSSHSSHSSHYSGSSGYPTYSTPQPRPSYPSPTPDTSFGIAATPLPVYPRSYPTKTPTQVAPAENTTRIELTNSTAMFGTILTKSASGITFKTLDGSVYKIGRNLLTNQTITALGLPDKQSATSTLSTPTPSTTTTTDDAASLRQKNADLEQTITALRNDNAQIREQLRALSGKSSTAVPNSPTATQRPPVNSNSTNLDQSQAYWISSTGKRHNKNCRYYGTGRGRPCGPNDGVPCKICGG